MNKTIYLILFSIALPASAFAAERWEMRSGRNMLEVAGTCSGREVRFDLYRGGDAEPIYTSGCLCREGVFEFKDDLLQWESLEDGTYELAVNGRRADGRQVVIERPTETVSGVGTSTRQSVPDIETDASSPRFLDAFVAFQQSLADMRIRLADSEYPDIVKMSLDAAIDGIDKIAGSMTDLLFASETGKDVISDEAIAAEKREGDAGTGTGQDGPDEETRTSEIDRSSGPEPSVSRIDATGLLASDGLSVVEGDVAPIVGNGV